MIAYGDLKSFISQGEDVYKEFKPNVSGQTEKIGKTICAFANDLNWVGGGYLFVGLNDDGSPSSNCESYDHVQKTIADICRDHISPPLTPIIKRLDLDGQDIYEVKIARSHNRPHRCQNVCFVRIASTVRKATLDEEISIKDSYQIPSFDHQSVERSSAADLDYNRFEAYLRDTKPPETLVMGEDLTTLLVNLDFAAQHGDDISLKVGTLLLFGSDPQKYFRHCAIQAVKFHGTDLSSPIASRETITGTLPDLILRARQFIESYTATTSVFLPDQQDRVDYHEYPSWAIREAIANSVAHRDWQQEGREIDIRIFDDRIEVISPGTLGGGLTVEDLGTGKRYIRNQLTADVLSELKYIEKAGTGIYRLKKEMEKNGSPEPEFRVDQNTFKVILPAHPFYSSQRFLEEAGQEKARANYPAAKTLYQKALEKNPKNYHALIGLGDLERDLGNREACRGLYKEAIEIDPTNPQAWLSHGFLEEKLGNTKSAREMYRQAVKKVFKPGVIYRSWAILEWRQKQYEQADKLFEEAIKKDPGDSISWYKRGQMNINSRTIQVKRQGEVQLKKALSLVNDNYIESDIYFLLARAMPSLHYSTDEIKNMYEKSLSLQPYRGATHYFYAMFLKRIGEHEKSEYHLQRSRKLRYIPRKRR